KERTVERDIKKLLQKGVFEEVFPCAAAGISLNVGKEKRKIITYCGNASLYPQKRKLKKNTYFDLASLTKPLATTMAILCLIKIKKIDMDEKLPSLLEKTINDEKKKITVRQLLGHCSGFPAHRDYFKIIKDIPFKKRGDFIEKLLLKEKIEYTPESKALYSDLGFMLLGRIVEKKSGYTLDKFVKEKILQPLNLEEKIFFNPLFENRQIQNNKDFAATEICPWRKKILAGEVHDDNCYAMGGVAGHSGLFGNIEGVTSYADFILDMWKDKKTHPNIDNRDLRNFLKRQKKIPGSSRTSGFDTTAKSGSSSGKYFSVKSAGHLGFSGTSLWIDPEKEIVVVLLSNRVHPSRENKKIVQFRPFFHDMTIERIFPKLKNKNFFMAE
ncbi:serine hydrolase, partial [Thermodesulfobacteriota bacterium]